MTKHLKTDGIKVIKVLLGAWIDVVLCTCSFANLQDFSRSTRPDLRDRYLPWKSSIPYAAAHALNFSEVILLIVGSSE